jgi:hypothetical protein
MLGEFVGEFAGFHSYDRLSSVRSCRLCPGAVCQRSEKERERQREREKQRERERKTKRERERQREREKDRESLCIL